MSEFNSAYTGEEIDQAIANYLSGSGNGVQMASGQVSGYTNGVLTISGLAFEPVMVVAHFVETNISLSTDVFSVAVNTANYTNTAQGFENFSAYWSYYLRSYTKPQTAVFTSDGVSWELVTSSITAKQVDWWAFGGFTIKDQAGEM